MKNIQQPPFQQKAIALGFTLGIHVIAVVGLLYLGMSRPPEPPKPIQTVLIRPEDLAQMMPVEETTPEPTVDEPIAETTDTSPDIPTLTPPVPIPPIPSAQAQNLAKQKQELAANEQKKMLEDQRKVEVAAKEKAEAEAKRKAEATAKANEQAKAKAEAAVKEKAEAEAKRKAEATAKANEQAKAKAEAAAKAKAEAEAESKRQAEAEAQKAKEAAAAKKAEAKQIASSAKRDFESRIKRAWNPPSSSAGQRATARITLSDSGAVLSVVVNTSDPDLKASIEAAVRSAAPFPMPSDPDARREARSITSSFTAQ